MSNNPQPAQAAPQGQPQDPEMQMLLDTQQQLYGQMQALQKKIDDARKGIGVPIGNATGVLQPNQQDIDYYLNSLNGQLADLQDSFNTTSAVVLRYREAANKDPNALSEADRQTLNVRRAELLATIERNTAELAQQQRQNAIDAAKLALAQATFDQANKADPDGALARAAQEAQTRLNGLQADAQAFDTTRLAPARQHLLEAQTAGQQWDIEHGKALEPGQIALQGSQQLVDEAQARASNLAGDVSQLDLEQKRAGTLGTYRQQLVAGIANHTYSDAEADRLWAEAQRKEATGGSTFDWQSRLNDQANTLFGNAAQAGMLTSGAGLDPNGAISNALAGVGIQWQQPQSQAMPYAPWAQSIGMNLQMPQLAQGQAAPWAGQVAQGAVQGAPVVVDHTGQSWDQIKASLAQPAVAGVALPPPSAGGLPSANGQAPPSVGPHPAALVTPATAAGTRATGFRP